MGREQQTEAEIGERAMSETDGRRRRGERAREQILSHATTMASVEGLEGLSIGRLAHEAGVGKGNIQVLFGDKEALQLATIEKAIALYETNVAAPALAKKTPLKQLTALIEGWYDFVDRKVLPGGCFIHAVSVEYRTRPGRIRDRINEYRSSRRARLRALIADAKAAGELRADVDEGQLVFELMAYQAAANVAAAMGDRDEFARSRRTSLAHIRAAAAAK
jgi:AcrR family transcriptional regulator